MAPPNEDEEAAGRSWLKKALVGSFVVMGLGIIAAVVVLVLYQTDVLSSGDDANTEGVSGGGESGPEYCTDLTLNRTGLISPRPIPYFFIGSGVFTIENRPVADRDYEVWLPLKIPKRKTDYISITNMTLKKDLSINKTCQKGTTFGYINNSPMRKLQSGVYVASGCAGEFTVCGKDCIDPSTTFCTGDTSGDTTGDKICVSQELYDKVCDHVNKTKCTVCHDTCWSQAPGLQTHENGGICYAYVTDKRNWTQAQSYCKSIGGYLAEPKTAEQNRFVQSVFLAAGKKDMWLGGDDLEKEGSWRWSSSGELFSTGFTDWGLIPPSGGNPGGREPSNEYGDQHCLQMFSWDGRNFNWDDVQCHYKRVSLCQKADLFSFGKKAGDKEMPYKWEWSTGAIDLDPPLTYFDDEYSSLYLIENGGISFNRSFRYYASYSPGDFPFWGNKTRDYKGKLPPLVAAYWADVDTHSYYGPGSSGDIYYRQIADTDDVDLKDAGTQIRRHLGNLNSPNATTMFLATWHNVRGFIYSTNNDIFAEKRCTFQLALVTMEDKTSFAIMNYQGLEWTTGVYYGGDPRTGLYNGGPTGGPALAGFDAGDEYNFFRLPASRTNQVMRLTQASNTNTPGRWIFKITKPDVDGGRSGNTWGGWSECVGTASQQYGTQTRNKSCNNPPPQNNGKQCPPDTATETQKCVFDKYGSCNNTWPFGPCQNGGLCTPKVTIADHTCACLPCFTGKNCQTDNVKDVNAAVKADKPDDLTAPLANLGFELDEEDRKRLVKELKDVEKNAGGPPDCGDLQDVIIRIKASEASTDTDNTTEATETNWIPYIAAGLGLLFLVSAIALTAFLVKKKKKRAAEEEEGAYEEDEMSEGEQGQSGAEAGDGAQSSHRSMPEGQSEVGVMGAITAGLSSLYGEKKSNPPSAAPSALAVPQANRGKSISQEGKKSNPASPSTSALAVPQANRGKSIGGENEDSSRKKSMANEDRKASLAHSSVDSAPIRKKSVAIENRKKSSVAPPRRF